MKNYTNAQLAFFAGRIALGVNFFIHGVARMGNVTGFADGISKGFSETLIPVSFAYAYGLFIPYFELIIGFLILSGLFTRTAIFLSGLFMATLITGMGLQQQWGTVGSQMIYVVVIFLLLINAEHNIWYIKK